MRRGSIRIPTVWLLALALIAPSLRHCACIVGCAMGTCSLGSHIHGGHRGSTGAGDSDRGHHGVPASVPMGHGHNEDTRHRGHGGCTCGCELASGDATIPASAPAIVLPLLPVVAILDSAPELCLSIAKIRQPGLLGYDSGPPTASLRLPVQDRSPPVHRA